ncbi:MAG: hypothetical protein BGP06_17885 [Rhizobiales bacterium 65-9]|nr:hypothetical protein [Hyphomicrobiales bacterium]OJY34717.1 MAG: hypothetical protein BGP06_17885 [Rhizobiales bacterium 65-9]
MTDKPKATPDAVAITAARGGYRVDEAAAKRIANAISPALTNFDCPALTLPMSEEPSGWDQRAKPERRS